MYNSYFSLKETPFNITPDPKFLFMSKRHEEALNILLYGIHERKGFMAVIGEVGTGKTTLCRLILEQMDDKVKTALILNPCLSEIELLRNINKDFGEIGIASSSESKIDLIDQLNRFLLRLISEGKNAVLIIDESQNLTSEVLEQIRLISNLETATEKLIQIILVGQPELDEKLRQARLRQLNQRIAIRCYLEPLTHAEVFAYIQYRLLVAGHRGNIIFTKKAVNMIYSYSSGIARRINMVCDRALLCAYVKNRVEIDHYIIKEAIKDLDGNMEKKRWVVTTYLFNKIRLIF